MGHRRPEHSSLVGRCSFGCSEWRGVWRTWERRELSGSPSGWKRILVLDHRVLERPAGFRSDSRISISDTDA